MSALFSSTQVRSEAQAFFSEANRPSPLAALISLVFALNVASVVAMLAAQG